MPEMAGDAIVIMGVTNEHELAAVSQGVEEGMVDGCMPFCSSSLPA
jgi:hypothetical protein